MSECPFQSRLSAFHDHELDADTARDLQAHLADCSSCSEMLAGIRALSRLFESADTGRMSQMGVARLHKVADQAVATRRQTFPFARTMVAAAASVLIVAGAWLMEVPAKTSTPIATPAVKIEPQWEKLASGGRMVLPSEFFPETRFVNREQPQQNVPQQIDFSDWMVNSLQNAPKPRKEKGS